MPQKFGMVTEFSPSYYNIIINICIIVYGVSCQTYLVYAKT